ncbi:hypothetical protein [Varibaculum cambriense]|uniref:hypothetical protein n=1 Tax=Varibaculum cambriense TaxID=184870 RepID=UPI00290137C1|nr:hypothetical protein [Varibaculum cambriense]MDU1225063.1 hypothetical protein [Varibaculum cambriense]
MADLNSDLLIPWALDAGTDDAPEYTGRDLRDLFAVFFEPRSEAEPFQAAPGILRGCSVSASSTEVTIQPGHCIVTTAGGSFLTGVKNPVTLPLAAPHATFNRIDLVALSIEETADSGRGAKIQVIQGTPNSSPSAPSIPDGAVVLASVRVLTAGAPTVTPGVEASLAGASKEPETKTFARGAGLRAGTVTGTCLPGGVWVINLQGGAWSGSSPVIANTSLRGYRGYQFIGSYAQLWWCGMEGDGVLKAYGDTPPAGYQVDGVFVLKRDE